MILASFLAALGQLGDPRFLRVTAAGVLLAILLLLVFSAGTIWLMELLLPDSISLPGIDPVGGIDTLAGWGMAAVMLLFSIFLMVPVASAFSGIFLGSVAAAVEARHYPGLPPARAASAGDSLIAGINFLGVIIAANLVALALWPLAGPGAPILFWAVNGYLLGREYFELAAERRLSPAEARRLRKANGGTVWLAGALMAAPLSVPLLNLFIPVIGAATFTHLLHRLERRGKRGEG